MGLVIIKQMGLAIVRYALMLLLLFTTFSLSAQTNLREGFVITLEGDTLTGYIDFRTGALNSQQCVFLKDGETSYTTYLPGQIQGYRFLNNGMYYVSKEVNDQVIFVEYLLRGNLNLYQIGEEKMLLEDEEGRQAAFSPQKAQRATKVKDRQAEMRDVLGMLNKSPKATNIIWKKEKNRQNTREAVSAYIDEVCPDGYCEVFEYRSKHTPEEDRIFHPWVKAGMKFTSYTFYSGESLGSFAPQVSAGCDFHLDRVYKGLMINASVAYEMGKASRDVESLFPGTPSVQLNGKKPSSLTFNQLDVMFGPGYQFQTGLFKTRVRCGGIYRVASKNFDYTNAIYYYRGGEYNNISERSETWRFNAQFGLYAGAGIEYPLRKCSLICDLDYIYDYNCWTALTGPDLMVSDSDETTIKQHGFCLSLGVKF